MLLPRIPASFLKNSDDKMDNYRILEWDSDVFNCKVAAILPLKLDEKPLADILDDLRAQNVRLVYWGPDAQHSSSCNAADSLNGLFTGIKRIYLADLSHMEDQYKITDANLMVHNASDISEDLINLVLERAVNSRFYRDPKIRNKHYKAMITQWISNSIDYNMVFVTMDKQNLVGFVSLNQKDSNGNIDFIVVDKQYAGKGVGKKLLSHSHHWLVTHGYKHVQAITQKENIEACNMYEKMGYCINIEQAFYHFWF